MLFVAPGYSHFLVVDCWEIAMIMMMWERIEQEMNKRKEFSLLLFVLLNKISLVFTFSTFLMIVSTLPAGCRIIWKSGNPTRRKFLKVTRRNWEVLYCNLYKLHISPYLNVKKSYNHIIVWLDRNLSAFSTIKRILVDSPDAPTGWLRFIMNLQYPRH